MLITGFNPQLSGVEPPLPGDLPEARGPLPTRRQQPCIRRARQQRVRHGARARRRGRLHRGKMATGKALGPSVASGRGTRRVRLVRVRDAACPLSTRGGGGGAGGGDAGEREVRMGRGGAAPLLLLCKCQRERYAERRGAGTGTCLFGVTICADASPREAAVCSAGALLGVRLGHGGRGLPHRTGTMKLLRFSLNPTSNSFKRQPVLLRSRLNFVGCRRLQASAGSRVVRQDRLAVGVEARGIVRTAGLTLSGPCDGSCGQTGDSSAATTSVARAMPRHREGGSGRSGVVAARGFATGARGQAGSGTDDSTTSNI